MEKSAGEKVRNHIPNDLAFSILSKLPVKSLKRFGCVHKSWTLLFENPYFMNIFRNNFISNHHSYYDDASLLLQQSSYDFHLLSGERFENMVKLDLPNPFEQEQDDPYFYFNVLDSSVAGTICLYQNIRVVLWNPTTEEFKIIPPSPAVESVPPYQEPSICLNGFGYDRVRDDYKLIRRVNFYEVTDDEAVPREPISYPPFWEIYSLRSNSWRKLDIDMPPCLFNVGGERVYMDGICHWQSYSETHDEFVLVSFDLGNEVFCTTPLPINDSFGSISTLTYLVVLNGSIALISWNSGTTTFHISILGELSVKESWTELFIVGPLPCVEHPIGAGKKGDIFFKKKDGELVWLDLNTELIEELGVKGSDNCYIVIYKKAFFRLEE